MPAVPVAPFVLKDATLLVGADNYEAHVSQVEFAPSVSTITWQGLTPAASFSDASSPSWTCALGYAQDWTTPNSLSQYLAEHQGETIAAEFVTNPGAGTHKANLIITPGAIGGSVNAYAVATVTLGVSGQPTYVPPVAADAAQDLGADTTTRRDDVADATPADRTTDPDDWATDTDDARRVSAT
jgi:hypothetical protein